MRLCLLFSFFLICSTPLQSAEMAGTLKKQSLNWLSARSEGGRLLPSSWDIAFRLPTANKITPGGVSSIAPTNLTLSGGGKSISVPITIKGISYHLSSNAGVSNGGSGLDATVSGKNVTIVGVGDGKKTISLSKLSSPFTHYRPIVESVDAAVWLTKFKASGAIKGVYRGAAPYTFSYIYERGGISVRHTINGTLMIKVDYNPTHINAVTVTGSGVIQPIYYGYPEKLVKGEAQYILNITGIFTNGVSMGLKPSPSSRYQLLSGASSPQIGIDYSVKCNSGCDKKDIITDGLADINNRTRRVKINSTNGTNAQAIIAVSFSNKKLSELKRDVYTGSFTLIFEAGL